ncbi:hypothetical protein ACN47E_006138 [Coniothyrium glycines]
MSQNPDSVVNQGPFSGHIKPSTPLEKSGHQPGRLTGKPAIPTFHAKPLPPGFAPPATTYPPHPSPSLHPAPRDPSPIPPGATSASVHDHLGHPGAGQTARELRDDSKGDVGLAGRRGARHVREYWDETGEVKEDPRFAVQRNLGDVPTGQRGTRGGPPAEERVPESAEHVNTAKARKGR